MTETTRVQGLTMLDDVPGLGVGADAFQRDEVIAYWESWQRATYTAECMAQAGHQWVVELDYPVEESAKIAQALGVDARPPTGPDPEVANAEYVDSLGPSGRDSYYKALYAESARDIDHARESGTAPGDRAGFAEGGCRGEAWAAIGSIWELREELASDLDAMRLEARSTSEFDTRIADYTKCALNHGAQVTSPADLETAALPVSVVSLVNEVCNRYWIEAVDAGVTSLIPRFRQEHAEPISRQQDRYSDTVDDMRQNEAFRAFVAEQAGRWDS